MIAGGKSFLLCAAYPAHGPALLGIQGQGGPGLAYVMDLYDVSQLLGFIGQDVP